MADETTSLINRLTGDRVPAEKAPATVVHEPKDPGQAVDVRGSERGKTPEEVVPARTEKPKPLTEEDRKLLEVRYKVVTGEDRFVEELSLEEIAKRGLLEKIVTTANQFPIIQQKYQERLEADKAKAGEVTRTPQELAVERQFQHEQATLQTVKYYEPYAEREIEFYIKNGLMESDLPEAYKKAVTSIVGILLYHLDEINSTKGTLGHAVDWIKLQIEQRNAGVVTDNVNKLIDGVAAKPEPFYQELKKPEVRQAFITFLRKDVNPDPSNLTADTMEKLYITFNAKALVEMVKKGAEPEKTPKESHRRAASDGGTPTVAAPAEAPPEKNLLTRLTEERLGPAAET